MMKMSRWCILPLLVSFLLSCSTPPVRESKGSKPEVTLLVASLNLNGFSKRIEKKDVKKVAELLKKEKIEVLAVQAITRYPGLETRVDFVDELGKQADMNIAFGEMVNNSGRQTGNAVFSSYPIRSKSNQPFDKVKSAKFEAALLTMIDGGIRPLYVVSTQLPTKAPADDQASCVAQISSLHSSKEDAVILAGNLPVPEKISGGNVYQSIGQTSARESGAMMWLLANDAVKVSEVRTIETDFGPMLVAQVGLFRQTLP